MLEVDASALALSGGEDYELLATLPGGRGRARARTCGRAFGVDLSEIGEIVGVRPRGRRTPTAGRAPLAPAGWDHFAQGSLSRVDDDARPPRPRRSRSPAPTRAAAPGIQADLKTFSALGVFGMTAITAVTMQNTEGVSGYEALPPQVVAEQIRAVVTDIGVDAAKTGMLASAAIVEAVADAVAETAIAEPRRGSGLGLQARASPARRGRRRRAPRAHPAARDARHAEPARGRGPCRARA